MKYSSFGNSRKVVLHHFEDFGKKGKFVSGVVNV
jgi:hypothetical protein